MNAKILCLVACGFMPMIASAQTETLDYTGLPFTPVNINGQFVGLPNITGEIQLSAPLGANLTDATVVPVSWSFNDPALNSVIASTGPCCTTDTFAFTTVNGVITGWDVDVSFLDSVPGSKTWSSIILSDVSGDTYKTGYNYNSSKCDGRDPCSLSLTQTATPCSWSASVAAAPEIDPASTAGGLALLLGGLAVLRGRKGVNVAKA
jgi:hypothetical protein